MFHSSSDNKKQREVIHCHLFYCFHVVANKRKKKKSMAGGQAGRMHGGAVEVNGGVGQQDGPDEEDELDEHHKHTVEKVKEIRGG